MESFQIGFFKYRYLTVFSERIPFQLLNKTLVPEDVWVSVGVGGWVAAVTLSFNS